MKTVTLLSLVLAFAGSISLAHAESSFYLQSCDQLTPAAPVLDSLNFDRDLIRLKSVASADGMTNHFVIELADQRSSLEGSPKPATACYEIVSDIAHPFLSIDFYNTRSFYSLLNHGLDAKKIPVIFVTSEGAHAAANLHLKVDAIKKTVTLE